MTTREPQPYLHTLGLIDLDDVDFVCAVEKEFGVTFSQQGLRSCETVGQLFDLARAGLPPDQQDDPALWPRYLKVVGEISGVDTARVSRDTLILGSGAPWLGQVIAVLIFAAIFLYAAWPE